MPSLLRDSWRELTGKFPRNNVPSNSPDTSRSPKFSDFLHLTPALLEELKRLLFAALAFIIVGMIVTFNIQWSDMRWKNSGDDMKPLVDLGFKVLPETDKIFLADLFMLTLLGGSICFTLFMADSHRARIIIARRIIWILTILVSFRGITLSVTTLPSPKNCVPLHPGSFFNMVNQGVQLILGGLKACTDNIYSGHSIFITTSVLLFRVYCKYPLIIYYSYLHGITGLGLLIATRLHYTVDVLLAVFITYAVHSIYYMIVDLCIEKHFLHIRRAEERLGDKDLYQRAAQIPNMLNTSWVGIVRWMDGLDIRFKLEDDDVVTHTTQFANQIQQQVLSRRKSNPTTTTDQQQQQQQQNVVVTSMSEMTQVVVVNPPENALQRNDSGQGTSTIRPSTTLSTDL